MELMEATQQGVVAGSGAGPIGWTVRSVQSLLDDGSIVGHLDGNHGALYPRSHEFSAYGVPYVGANDFVGRYVSFQNCKFLPEQRARQFRKGIAQDGDVLFAHNATVGPVASIQTDHSFVILSTTATYFRCNNDKLHARFLHYVLQSDFFADQYKAVMSQSTRNQVPITAQRKLSVSLPPTLAEQEAIAEALSDADALIESLEQLIAKKRQIKQGAMQQLLTGKTRLPGFEGTGASFQQTALGEIPSDWKLIEMSDACLKIQDGTHFSPRTGGSDFLYVTSKNIRFGYLDFSTAERIDAAQHRSIYKRCDVQKGDLLLTKDGANTGNAAINSHDEEFSLLSSVAFLRFKSDRHDARYFVQQVLSHEGQKQIQDAMAGNAITRLTLEKINKLRFPAPASITEQSAIAKVLISMDTELSALEAKLAKYRQIKQGMMHNLLTGRIRLV